ncbi:MAG: DUF4286 family protein [Chitinophagaceae bacterium]|nr:DUF4286 family protein [Chitinophagaceae bacterium]
MIIFNITTKISWEVHEQWKTWLINEQVPQILATGLFEQYQLVHLYEMDDEDGPTYALQLYSSSQDNLDSYRTDHIHRFEKKERDLWGDSFVSFHSVMRVIN